MIHQHYRHHRSAKFCIVSLAIALGLTWGLTLLIIGLGSTWYGWGTSFVNILNSVYVGYVPTVAGSFVGFLWGLVDGAISGVVFGLLYNCFITGCGCCRRWKCRGCDCKDCNCAGCGCTGASGEACTCPCNGCGTKEVKIKKVV